MNTRTATHSEYVVCIENADYPVSLEIHRIYRALPDEEALAAGDLRILDESGEDYLFSADAFVAISLPERVRSSLCRAAESWILNGKQRVASRPGIFKQVPTLRMESLLCLGTRPLRGSICAGRRDTHPALRMRSGRL